MSTFPNHPPHDGRTVYNLVWDGANWVEMTQPGGSGGGGTSSTFGSAFPATGTAVGFLDSTGLLMAAGNLDASGNLKVAVTGAGSGGTSSADRATYTAGTTAGTPQMIARDDSSPGTLAEDKVGVQRGSSLREAYIQIRDAAQNDRGANVDASGNLAVAAASLPLPTGAATSAAQTTGNASLASIDTKTLQELSLDYDTGAGTSAMILVGFALPASGGPVAGGTATNPVRVDVTGSTTQPISASSLPLPTGASTAAKQPALGTAGTASSDVLSIQGVASMTPVKTDGSGVTQPVSAAALPLPTGAATSAKQPALGTAGSPSTDVLSIQGVASGTKLPISSADGDQATIGVTTGTAVITDATGTLQQYLRGIVKLLAAGITVALAAGSAIIGKVGIDQTTPGTTNGVALVPRTSGGYSTYHLVSANSTNATVVKGSAGQLFGWSLYNSNAAARKLAFHNASSTPTAGASIFFTIVLPPGSGANVLCETGIPFSTGIAITTVTGLADSDNSAVAVNDLNINLFYV